MRYRVDSARHDPESWPKPAKRVASVLAGAPYGKLVPRERIVHRVRERWGKGKSLSWARVTTLRGLRYLRGHGIIADETDMRAAASTLRQELEQKGVHLPEDDNIENERGYLLLYSRDPIVTDLDSVSTRLARFRRTFELWVERHPNSSLSPESRKLLNDRWAERPLQLVNDRMGVLTEFVEIAQDLVRLTPSILSYVADTDSTDQTLDLLRSKMPMWAVEAVRLESAALLAKAPKIPIGSIVSIRRADGQVLGRFRKQPMVARAIKKDLRRQLTPIVLKWNTLLGRLSRDLSPLVAMAEQTSKEDSVPSEKAGSRETSPFPEGSPELVPPRPSIDGGTNP